MAVKQFQFGVVAAVANRFAFAAQPEPVGIAADPGVHFPGERAVIARPPLLLLELLRAAGARLREV